MKLVGQLSNGKTTATSSFKVEFKNPGGYSQEVETTQDDAEITVAVDDEGTDEETMAINES